VFNEEPEMNVNIDTLVAKHTGFSTLKEMCAQWERHHYRPTIRTKGLDMKREETWELIRIANAYDDRMAWKGLNVKAYRGG
jgi:hypothetical protein